MPSVTFNLSESGGKIVASPDAHEITHFNTSVVFELVGQAAHDYRILGYTSDDSLSQLGPASIDKNETRMTLVDANSKETDINVNVLTALRTESQSVGTDPILMNRPPK